MLGYAPGEWIRSTDDWLRDVHPDDVELTRRLFEKHLHGEVLQFTHDFRMKTKLGQWRWIRSKGKVAARSAEGQAVVMAGTHTDITVQRAAQDALHDSERRYRALAELAPKAIVVHRDEKVLYVNYAAIKMTGARSEHELLGTSIFDRIHPDSRQNLLERLKRLKERGGDGSLIEFKLLKLDGTIVDAETESAVIPYDGSHAVQSVMANISERKQAELEMLRTQAKLQEMVGEAMTKVQALSIELLTSEARERRQMSEDLHDNLGQCLTMVRYKLRSLTALDDGRAEGEAMHQLRDIARSVELAAQSVRSVTAQLWPPVLYKFGLGAALEWLAGEMETNQGLHVSLQLGRLAPLDEITSICLFRAARELLTNVWKHAQISRAELRAAMDMDRHTLVLCVADAGVGFDVGQEPNVSATNSFGLFSVSERTKLIGGTMDIESQPGWGTTVTITLPVPATPP
jgi:PAS domain S-box-containing protein